MKKKRLWIALLSAGMAFSLAACGETENSGDNTKPTDVIPDDGGNNQQGNENQNQPKEDEVDFTEGETDPTTLKNEAKAQVNSVLSEPVIVALQIGQIVSPEQSLIDAAADVRVREIRNDLVRPAGLIGQDDPLGPVGGAVIRCDNLKGEIRLLHQDTVQRLGHIGLLVIGTEPYGHFRLCHDSSPAKRMPH